MPLAFLLGQIKKILTPQPRQDEWFLDRSSLDVDADLTEDKGR